MSGFRGVPTSFLPDARTAAWLRVDRTPVGRALRSLGRDLLRRTDARVFTVVTPRRWEEPIPCALAIASALAAEGGAPTLMIEAVDGTHRASRTLGFDPAPFVLGDNGRADAAPWTVFQGDHPPIHVLPVETLAATSTRRAEATRTVVPLARASGYLGVVIDAASVLDDDEWSVAADASDGVVVVVPRVRTRARDLKQAVDAVAPASVLALLLV